MRRYNIYPEGLGEINIDMEDDGEYIKYDDIKPLIEWYKALPNCHKCRDADFPSLEPLFNATCARCLINFKKDKPDLEI